MYTIHDNDVKQYERIIIDACERIDKNRMRLRITNNDVESFARKFVVLIDAYITFEQQMCDNDNDPIDNDWIDKLLIDIFFESRNIDVHV